MNIHLKYEPVSPSHSSHHVPFLYSFLCPWKVTSFPDFFCNFSDDIYNKYLPWCEIITEDLDWHLFFLEWSLYLDQEPHCELHVDLELHLELEQYCCLSPQYLWRIHRSVMSELLQKFSSAQVWWLVPLTSVLGRRRQGDSCGVVVSLDHIVSSKQPGLQARPPLKRGFFFWKNFLKKLNCKF